MSLERTIFSNLVNNEQYLRKAIPFLRSEYFHNSSERTVFNLIESYILKYNTSPTKETLSIDLDNQDNISDDQYTECKEIIKELPNQVEKTNQEWLIEETEKFCQDKAIYNAIMQSIKVLDDKTGALSKGSIPNLLSEALAVSFDSAIGHDFLDDTDSRYEFYHRKEERLPFDIEYLNKITRGGLPKKTLNILIAMTGGGKSLVKCHMAAANLAMGKNVLYITMEMAEEKIAERIDANLLNVRLDELAELPKSSFDKKIAKLKEKTVGKLIIKEYPTSSAGSANFRHLLNELKLKKGFVPDIIYIDYLNICSSSKLKMGANVNSYTYVKTIAEELRGLAIEFNVPIVSSSQTAKTGYNNSDITMTDTSESYGLNSTADLMLAIISTDELKEMHQLMFKQLKNRYADPDMYGRFVVGVDKSKMRIYNVEDSAQENLMDDTAIFDKGKYQERVDEESPFKKQFKKPNTDWSQFK
jgi:replicative DNA helicase